MTRDKLIFVAVAFCAAACAQNAKPVAVAAAPPPDVVTTAPTPLVAPQAAPVMDPALLDKAQRALRALGYNAGKSGDGADPVFQKAILAFEKDQGMLEDGSLTAALVDRMEGVHNTLLKAAAESNRSALFVYSDGTVRRQPLGLLIAPPKGLVSDAPANFLQPLRPGSQAAFHFGHRATDGSVTPAMTVTCRAGRMGPASLALGASDAVAVDCLGDDGRAPLRWRAVTSAKAGMVLRLEDASGVHDLVAIRPITADWPVAARTGLDWAITAALEMTVAAPVQWSSTGVAPHFKISATGPTLSGHDAGLGEHYAALPCRRFDMVQSGTPTLHYPGIACQNAAGLWSLPGSPTPLASPAKTIALRAAAPGSGSNH